MRPKIHALYQKGIFYGLQLPLIFFAITAGLIFEYLLQFPFMIALYLDKWLNRRQH